MSLPTLAANLHPCPHNPHLQAFSNTLYAMARLGVKPTREWIVAFFRISQPLLPRFSGQGLANMLWALARLHIRPGVGSGSQAWEKALYGAACVQLETGGFTPQAVANVTWALATLDLYPPQDFQSALVAAARVYLPHFSEQGLANVVWGIAKLRCPVRTSWMDALVRVRGCSALHGVLSLQYATAQCACCQAPSAP